MFRLLLFIVPVLLSYAYCTGQGVKSILDNEVNPGEVLVEFDNRSSGVKGTFYINEDWRKGDITLKSGTEIKNQWIRYDLEYDMLEVKLSEKVKVIPLRKLDQYKIIDKKNNNIYSNCDRYQFEDGTALSGICRVLDTGSFGAIVKYDYKIKKADYVPSLDMGSRDDEIIIKKHTFLTKNENIYRLPKNKKDFFNFFINPSTDIKSFMKKNKLSHRKEEDLVRILHFLNDNNN